MEFELSGIREDLVTLLSIGVGKDAAEKKVGELESLIRSQAQAGAQAAAPDIRKEVRAEVKSVLRPWIIALLAVSGVALIASAATVVYVRRSKR